MTKNVIYFGFNKHTLLVIEIKIKILRSTCHVDIYEIDSGLILTLLSSLLLVDIFIEIYQIKYDICIENIIYKRKNHTQTLESLFKFNNELLIYSE